MTEHRDDLILECIRYQETAAYAHKASVAAMGRNRLFAVRAQDVARKQAAVARYSLLRLVTIGINHDNER